jgi:hypothetical protein
MAYADSDDRAGVPVSIRSSLPEGSGRQDTLVGTVTEIRPLRTEEQPDRRAGTRTCWTGWSARAPPPSP